MIRHYLKIAWRNLLKYKTQSVITVVGLAIGFTAFSFTMSWIRFERGYDKDIENADRIYRVLLKDSTSVGGIQPYTPNAMTAYLKGLYPEIEEATGISIYKGEFRTNNRSLLLANCNYLHADTSFFKVFYPDIKIDFPEVLDKTYYILTESTATKLGLSYKDIGRNIDSLNINLLSIVPDKSKQTNIPFDIALLSKSNPDFNDSWGYYSRHTYILVHEKADIETLKSKFNELIIHTQLAENISRDTPYPSKLVALTELRITHPDDEVSIKYQHLRLFAAVAFLVIFCAFFNYLMLFINNIRLRSRGLTLQKINGASVKQLLSLLFLEFTILLIIALLIGLALTELLFPSFVKFSMIEAERSHFVLDAILFGFALLITSVVTAYFPIKFFMLRSIKENLLPQKQQNIGIKDSFTLTTIALQLFIGILLIFSTTIYIYQYQYLNSKYIGFNRYNKNAMFTEQNALPLNEIKKIPGVIDIIQYGGDFLPKSHMRRISFEGIELFEFVLYGPEFVDFFDINIVEGRNIYEDEKKAYLINETAQRLLTKQDSDKELIIYGIPVVGVIQDMYIDSPLLPVLPSVYKLHDPTHWELEHLHFSTKAYVYKYEKDLRFETEKAIQKLITEEIGNESVRIVNMEEKYEEYTQSERYLLTLLSIMTGVTILIAIFGIYSIVTLACNRRRKEIAIRKVNGATVKEIFMLFFKQYLWITIAASAIAFPIGVFVMQRWLEQYTRRVSMEWWLFAGVFALVLLIVMASMIFRVVKAAKENPAEVVKSK
jgi:ABC-type antimicrobial peptide transport system permease subunit